MGAAENLRIWGAVGLFEKCRGGLFCWQPTQAWSIKTFLLRISQRPNGLATVNQGNEGDEEERRGWFFILWGVKDIADRRKERNKSSFVVRERIMHQLRRLELCRGAKIVSFGLGKFFFFPDRFPAYRHVTSLAKAPSIRKLAEMHAASVPDFFGVFVSVWGRNIVPKPPF